MEFHLVLEGEFNNVAGCSAPQRCVIDVECGLCKTVAKNLSLDVVTFNSYKVDEKNEVKYTNLLLECKACKGFLKV